MNRERLRARLTGFVAHPAVFLIALGVAVVVLYVTLFPPERQGMIRPDSIRAESGHAWIAPLPIRPSRWFFVRGSDVGITPSGVLLMYEDGIPLAPRDAGHDDIRARGLGGYSHWGIGLYFSTSDNTDPRVNGRVYSFRVGSQPRVGTTLLGALGGLLGSMGALLWLRGARARGVVTRRWEIASRGAAAILGVALFAGVVLYLARPAIERELRTDAPSSARGATAVDTRAFAPCCGRWFQASVDRVWLDGRPIEASPDLSSLRRSTQPAWLQVDRHLVLRLPDDHSAPALRASAQLVPAPVALLTIALLAAAAAALARATRRAGTFAVDGFLVRFRPRLEIALAIALGAVMAWLLAANWREAAHGHLGAASLLPVSDAMGYLRCAILAPEQTSAAGLVAAAEAQGMSAEWCSRRSIWPLALATLLNAGGWHAGVVLLMQAVMLGVALGVAVHAALRAIGPVGAIVLAWIGVLYLRDWAIGNFMTEVYGAGAGLVAIALLLHHARRPSPWLLGGGIGLLSIALFARAGALFVLPLVALWGYATYRRTGAWLDWRRGLLVAAALAAGPALHVAGAVHYAGDAANSGGNFSVSLYGLSTGTRDWSQAYRDLPGPFASERELFRAAHQKAIENITASPRVFLESLRAAGLAHVEAIFQIAEGIPAPQAWSALMWIGVAFALWHWRRPSMTLLLVLLAGELLAAPLIIDSGGQRVFAATVWVRPLLAALGIVAIVRVARRAVSPAGETGAVDATHAEPTTLPAVTIGVALVLLALPLAPLIAPAGSMRLPSTDRTAACSPGDFPLVAHVGRESLALSIAPAHRAPLTDAMQIRIGQLEANTAWQSNWISRGVGPLPAGSTLIVAFDRQSGSRGRTLSLISDRPLPPSADGAYRICAGPATSRTLGDFGLNPIRSIEAIDPLGRPTR